jgi:hypothetical protein
MKIVQQPISDFHQSAMFFDGVVATGERDGKKYTLKTVQTGEIVYNEKEYSEGQIRQLGQMGILDDTDIEEEKTISVLVDRFLAITEEGAEVAEDAEVYNDFTEGIIAFKEFLR